ncbi:MAG: hypothetical protein JXQ82_10190 [Methanomicrobiaceae archaeon]|nr:hypothetical protein [Methanomicrobiaceae archaeon]
MIKKAVLAVIILVFAIFLMLYLQNPVAFENKTEENPASFENESSLDEQDAGGNISGPGVAGGEESDEPDYYPDALGIGESIWYDEDTYNQYPAGENKNDISVSVDEIRISETLYLKNLSTGSELPVMPSQGFRYLLVKVSAAPVGEYLIRHTSPVTNSFELLDSTEVYRPLLEISEDMGAIMKNETLWDTQVNENFVISNIGRIYVAKTMFSSLNDAGGSGPVSGWIIFEVPESFVISPDTYLKLSVGKNAVLWRLHDIRAYIDVYISPGSGNIRILYKGGPDQYLVTAISAALRKTDGSVILRSIEKAEDEESLSPWSEIMIYGSGPVAGEELLTVELIRFDGEKYTKYRKFV